MNLSLETLLWVLPGIAFLFSYNRLRDVESLEFSGWPYVFFLVLIGTVTYLPINYFFKDLGLLFVVLISSFTAFLIPFVVKFIFNPFVEKLDENENFFIPSNFWSVIYFFYPIENRDKFIKSCMDYEGKAILLTIDERLLVADEGRSTDGERFNSPLNVYTTTVFGILIEFPYVSTSDVSSQTIRVLPLLSGYKYVSSDRERFKWIKRYTIEEDSEGIIIPRNKIIRLSLYNEENHKDMVFATE